MPVATDALEKMLALSLLVGRDLERFERTERMTSPRVHLLWQLGADGPSTQRDLAHALDVSPRNITGLVDGLVASGHVTREPHPTDRRATLVTPTAAGAALFAALQHSHAALAERLFGHLDEQRLGAFVTALDDTLDRFPTPLEQSA